MAPERSMDRGLLLLLSWFLSMRKLYKYSVQVGGPQYVLTQGPNGGVASPPWAFEGQWWSIWVSISQSIQTLFCFVTCVAQLKDDILLVQAARHPLSVALDLLPKSVWDFLSHVCSLSPDMTDAWWSALNDAMWAGDNFAHFGGSNKTLFALHYWLWNGTQEGWATTGSSLHLRQRCIACLVSSPLLWRLVILSVLILLLVTENYLQYQPAKSTTTITSGSRMIQGCTMLGKKFQILFK